MPNDGSVVFQIDGDSRPLKASLDDATKAIDKAGKTWEKSTQQSADGMEYSLNNMLKKAVAGFSAAKLGKFLLDFGKDAIQAASDLEEVQNVVDVTFGEGSKQIDTWAKNASKQFGLTELQAKQFTSTLGAMMKSAGMAGPEIIEMSEGLAGLAADMASFYNLDFDTAFQKIRSGLSGEVEPLKALGISMSQANLEAFALEKGIQKTVSAMSQAELTSLRYQYLMKATADAQGDFARTGDSYANQVKKFENNINSLKANMGAPLLGIINEATSALNSLLEKVNGVGSSGTADKLAQIENDTRAAILEIGRKSAEVDGYFNTLEALQEKANNLNNAPIVSYMNGIKTESGKLDATSAQNWQTLFNALAQGDRFGDFFDDPGAMADIVGSLTDLSSDTADAWQTLLNALGSDKEALSRLTGKDAEGAAEWLNTLKEAATGLAPDDVEGWSALFTELATGMPGLDENSPAAILAAIASGAGFTRDQIERFSNGTGEASEAMTQWLATLRAAVQVVPGLSAVIDADTGAIKGGVTALREWKKAWEETELSKARDVDIESRKAVLAEGKANITALKAQLENDLAVREEYQKKIDALKKRYGVRFTDPRALLEETRGTDDYEEAKLYTEEILKLNARINEAQSTISKETAATDALERELNALGVTTEQTAAAEESLSEAGKHLVVTNEEAQQRIDNLKTALEEMQRVIDQTRQETASKIGQTVQGFEKLQTAKERIQEIHDNLEDMSAELEKAQTDAEKKEINIRITGTDESLVTIQRMTAALQSQLDYMREYQENMRKAQEMGYSADLLATLADGSTESSMRLAAMTASDVTKNQVDQLNTIFDAVNTEKEGFTDAMTTIKLSADESFAAILDAANKAVAELDMADGTKEAASSTMQGLIDGINAMMGPLSSSVSQVQELMAQLESYGSIGLGFSGGSLDIGSVVGGFSSRLVQPTVLTNTGSGSPIVVNSNLYVDGKKMAESVSTHQANSLSTLERSGAHYTD